MTRPGAGPARTLIVLGRNSAEASLLVGQIEMSVDTRRPTGLRWPGSAPIGLENVDGCSFSLVRFYRQFECVDFGGNSAEQCQTNLRPSDDCIR
jgi:hypothetical protein